jgi:hypothetical protein
VSDRATAAFFHFFRIYHSSDYSVIGHIIAAVVRKLRQVITVRTDI